MNNLKRVFSKEFKEETVRLVLEGKRSRKEICVNFELHSSVLDRWIKQYKSDPKNNFLREREIKTGRRRIKAAKT